MRSLSEDEVFELAENIRLSRAGFLKGFKHGLKPKTIEDFDGCIRILELIYSSSDYHPGDEAFNLIDELYVRELNKRSSTLMKFDSMRMVEARRRKLYDLMSFENEHNFYFAARNNFYWYDNGLSDIDDYDVDLDDFSANGGEEGLESLLIVDSDD